MLVFVREMCVEVAFMLFCSQRLSSGSQIVQIQKFWWVREPLTTTARPGSSMYAQHKHLLLAQCAKLKRYVHDIL